MKVTTSFGKFAALWDKQIGDDGGSGKVTADAIRKIIGPVKNKTIYELACGNGYLSRQFVRLGAKKVFASDVAKEMIDIASHKYPADKINYLVREATNFSGIPKSYFDIVVIEHGIFYIKDIEKLLQGIKTSLKPGGVFVFSILHPLFPEGRKALGHTHAMGEDLDTKKIHEQYLKNYSKIVSKNWGDQTVHYRTYKRPLSYYINLCGKAGLLTQEIIEIPSQSKVKGKIKKSTIPSAMVIKVVKH